MLNKAEDDLDLHPEKKTMRVKVHSCDTCDKSLFYVSCDNRIVCATCCKFIEGWHALGTKFAS